MVYECQHKGFLSATVYSQKWVYKNSPNNKVQLFEKKKYSLNGKLDGESGQRKAETRTKSK